MKYAIRKIVLSDVNNRFQAISNSMDDLKRWFPWVHDNYSLEECREWIDKSNLSRADGKDYNFAIIEEFTGEYIGEVKIMDVKRDYCECNAALAYWVRSDWFRKGAASSAIKQAALFAFDELKLLRLKIMIDLNNAPSQKVIESCSAKFEGVLRNQWKFGSRVFNIKLYSLIPEDL